MMPYPVVISYISTGVCKITSKETKKIDGIDCPIFKIIINYNCGNNKVMSLFLHYRYVNVRGTWKFPMYIEQIKTE